MFNAAVVLMRYTLLFVANYFVDSHFMGFI